MRLALDAQDKWLGTMPHVPVYLRVWMRVYHHISSTVHIFTFATFKLLNTTCRPEALVVKSKLLETETHLAGEMTTTTTLDPWLQWFFVAKMHRMIFVCLVFNRFSPCNDWGVVSNIFLFSSLLGEMIQFDFCDIFQMGWNHRLVFVCPVFNRFSPCNEVTTQAPLTLVMTTITTTPGGLRQRISTYLGHKFAQVPSLGISSCYQPNRLQENLLIMLISA